MNDRFLKLLEPLHGTVGVYYSCPETGEVFTFNEREPVVAASVIKLTVMAEAFRRFEEGSLDRESFVTVRDQDRLPSCGALTYLHDGIRVTLMDLVTLMIILSDNTATNLLIDLLGMDAINRTIGNLGLQGTQLNRKLFMPELSARGIENWVTAADMGLFMEKLLRGEIISANASAEMLRILGNQRLNGKIPFYLHSRGIRTAHKTGEDDGITHDVGILWTEPPRVLCIVSEHTDVPETERVIQEIAGIAAGIR